MYKVLNFATCTTLYIKKIWGRAFDKRRKSLRTSRGENKMAAEEFFLNILSVFHQCTACWTYAMGTKLSFYRGKCNSMKKRCKWCINTSLYSSCALATPQPGQLRGICPSCQSQGGALANLTRPGVRAFAYPGGTTEKFVDVFLIFKMYFNLKSHNFKANFKERV